jgi:hypothetical protein
VISEPSVVLFTVSGYQMDALVSDYSSKGKSSTGQKARWQAAPIERQPPGVFPPSLLQPHGNTEHLFTVLPTRVFACPKSDSAPGITVEVWNLLAAIEHGACLIDKAEEYGT